MLTGSPQANVFFLGQPLGVGFSHEENGQTLSTTEEAAVDIATFVDIVLLQGVQEPGGKVVDPALARSRSRSFRSC